MRPSGVLKTSLRVLAGATHELSALSRLAAMAPAMAGCLALSLGLTASAQEQPPPGYPPSGCDYDQRGQHYCWGGAGGTKAAPAPAPDVWGAIAVSPSTLLAGTSWNYRSAAEASNRALSECRALHAADCKIVVTVADVCAALATSKPDKVYAVGGPIGAADFADGNATLKCRRAGGKACTVVVSFCADGVRHVVHQQSAAPGRRR